MKDPFEFQPKATPTPPRDLPPTAQSMVKVLLDSATQGGQIRVHGRDGDRADWFVVDVDEARREFRQNEER